MQSGEATGFPFISTDHLPTLKRYPRWSMAALTGVPGEACAGSARSALKCSASTWFHTCPRKVDLLCQFGALQTLRNKCERCFETLCLAHAFVTWRRSTAVVAMQPAICRDDY